METKYTVHYVRHNKTDDAWAYKMELMTENYQEALDKYFALLSEVTTTSKFDFITVVVEDITGTQLRKESRKITPANA